MMYLDHLDTVEVIGSIPVAPTLFRFNRLGRIPEISNGPENTLHLTPI